MKSLATQDIYFSSAKRAFVVKRRDDVSFILIDIIDDSQVQPATVSFISAAIKAYILLGFEVISYEEALDFQQKYIIFQKEVESRDKIFISYKKQFYVLTKDKDKIHNPYIFFEVGSEVLSHSGYHDSASKALRYALANPDTKIVSYADTLK